jgi:DNA-binding MarR family transcriptional regulator
MHDDPIERDDPCAGAQATLRDINELLYARPGFLLRRAHQISVSIFESAFSELGITPGQYAVLMALQADCTQDQSSVARAIGLDKVTVSLLLRGLETRGLVDRRVQRDNRRKRVLTVTTAGLALLQRTEAPADEAYERLMAPFDATQRQALLGLLQQLVVDLEHCARAPMVALTTQSSLDLSP